MSIDWNLHDITFAIKSIILDLRSFSREQEIWFRAYTAALSSPNYKNAYSMADQAVREFEHRFSAPDIITNNQENQNE